MRVSASRLLKIDDRLHIREHVDREKHGRWPVQHQSLDRAPFAVVQRYRHADNSAGILRRAIGSKRSYFTMTSESEVRAAQADKTWAWLVTDGNGKYRIQDLTFNHNYFLCC